MFGSTNTAEDNKHRGVTLELENQKCEGLWLREFAIYPSYAVDKVKEHCMLKISAEGVCLSLMENC